MNRMTRRRCLQRLSRISMAAGVLPLFAPFLQRVQAEAGGKTSPGRFLFVIKSSGLTPAELVPTGMPGIKINPGEEEGWPHEVDPLEALVDAPLEKEKLPATLKPLQPFVERLAILQGLSGKMCRGGHSAWYGALGCYHTGDEGDPGRAQSATIDGALATALPGIFPHIGLTLGGKVLSGVKDSVIYPGISAMATDRPLAYQANPLMAFKNLFGMTASGETAAADAQLSSMLLDHLVDDVKRLKQKTGNADREKLDRYLGAFEGLRDRRRVLKGMEAELRRHAPVVDDKYSSNVETDRVEAHFDLAAAALITGLTNVVSIRADTLDVTYRGLGISKHVHGLGHAESVNGMTPIEARNRIRTFQVEQIARVAAKLDAIPEGDGTMLDNTLIVYLSDAAEKHHASCTEWPFLLLGGLGQKLKHGGRYLHFPGYEREGHRTIAGLYCTLLHAIGSPADTFGRFDLNLAETGQRGPLSELLRG